MPVAGPHATLRARLQKQIYLHGDDRKLFERLIGKVTAQNIVVALVFADIVDDDSTTIESLAKAVKPFGINLAAFRGGVQGRAEAGGREEDVREEAVARLSFSTNLSEDQLPASRCLLWRAP